MKVLIGTTNPSKVTWLEELLYGYDIEFYTLKDLKIETEPEEQGKTPEENAILKAKYYGQFFDCVVCNDSGLYFEGIELDDERQPGLKIRTPNGNERLDDEGMIDYYTKLIHSLGGKILAYYLNGIAVYRNGKILSFMENDTAKRINAFYMIDQPSEKRHKGWPLDSISLNRGSNTYFVDEDDEVSDSINDNIQVSEYKMRMTAFLIEALGIK